MTNDRQTSDEDDDFWFGVPRNRASIYLGVAKPPPGGYLKQPRMPVRWQIVYAVVLYNPVATLPVLYVVLGSWVTAALLTLIIWLFGVVIFGSYAAWRSVRSANRRAARRQLG